MIQFHWDFAQKNKNGSVAILWKVGVESTLADPGSQILQ